MHVYIQYAHIKIYTYMYLCIYMYIYAYTHIYILMKTQGLLNSYMMIYNKKIHIGDAEKNKFDVTKAMRKFHVKHYRPENMALSLVGIFLLFVC
jgi:hypothetical protein